MRWLHSSLHLTHSRFSNWLRKSLLANSIRYRAVLAMTYSNWCLQCCKETQQSAPRSTRYSKCLRLRRESITSWGAKPSRTNSLTRFYTTRTCLRSSVKASKCKSRRIRSRPRKLRKLLLTCPRPSTWTNKIMILAFSITSMLSTSTQ